MWTSPRGRSGGGSSAAGGSPATTCCPGCARPRTRGSSRPAAARLAGTGDAADRPLATTDLDALLAQPGLDAVYVATPNAAHRTVVEPVAARRIPVLCEKPLAADVDDAAAIVASSSGLLAGTAFDQRFHPAHRRIAKMVGAGELGTVTAVRIVYACWLPPDWSPYGTSSEQFGSVTRSGRPTSEAGGVLFSGHVAFNGDLLKVDLDGETPVGLSCHKASTRRSRCRTRRSASPARWSSGWSSTPSRRRSSSPGRCRPSRCWRSSTGSSPASRWPGRSRWTSSHDPCAPPDPG